MISFLQDAILENFSTRYLCILEAKTNTICKKYIKHIDSLHQMNSEYAKSNSLITFAFVSASGIGYSKLVERYKNHLYFHIFERRLAEMRGGKNRVRNDRALLPGNSFNKSTTVNRPRIRAHVAQSLSVH